MDYMLKTLFINSRPEKNASLNSRLAVPTIAKVRSAKKQELLSGIVCIHSERRQIARSWLECVTLLRADCESRITISRSCQKYQVCMCAENNIDSQRERFIHFNQFDRRPELDDLVFGCAETDTNTRFLRRRYYGDISWWWTSRSSYRFKNIFFLLGIGD